MRAYIEQALDAYAAEDDTLCTNLMLEVIQEQDKKIKELENNLRATIQLVTQLTQSVNKIARWVAFD